MVMLVLGLRMMRNIKTDWRIFVFVSSQNNLTNEMSSILPLPAAKNCLVYIDLCI